MALWIRALAQCSFTRLADKSVGQEPHKSGLNRAVDAPLIYNTTRTEAADETTNALLRPAQETMAKGRGEPCTPAKCSRRHGLKAISTLDAPREAVCHHASLVLSPRCSLRRSSSSALLRPALLKPGSPAPPRGPPPLLSSPSSCSPWPRLSPLPPSAPGSCSLGSFGSFRRATS